MKFYALKSFYSEHNIPFHIVYTSIVYTLTFDAIYIYICVLCEQVVDGGHKSMHKAFNEGSLLLSYFFNHVYVWDVVEFLPTDLPRERSLGVPPNRGGH